MIIDNSFAADTRMSIKINCDHTAKKDCFSLNNNGLQQKQIEGGAALSPTGAVEMDVSISKAHILKCSPYRKRLKMRSGCCKDQKQRHESTVIAAASTSKTYNFCCVSPSAVLNSSTTKLMSLSSSLACSAASASLLATAAFEFDNNIVNRKNSSSETNLKWSKTFPITETELSTRTIITDTVQTVSLRTSLMPIPAANIPIACTIEHATEINRDLDLHYCNSNVLLGIAHNKSCTHKHTQYFTRIDRSYKYNNHNYVIKNNSKAPIVDVWQQTIFRVLRQQQQFLLNMFIIILLLLMSRTTSCHGLLVLDPTFVGLSDGISNSNSDSSSILNSSYNNTRSVGSGLSSSPSGVVGSSILATTAVGGSAHYLDKLDNLERSVAAVLIKVAYGTTSTTKRSIPDNSYVPSLTTIATPQLTTLRYLEKSPHQQQINLHHRNYELDLERDHALPTSAPNADILKSNSNPTYPNPNRHHNHDRERHRHVLNSTPSPSLSNILKKNNSQPPTIPLYPGDMPSYSPPARSFFTPPLPPEYQNPFADKPTLRGTNNDGVVANTGTYINRRPIPPPSLMPGHERIPFRRPDLTGSSGSIGGHPAVGVSSTFSSSASGLNPIIPSNPPGTDAERKKALNTPSRGNGIQLVGHANVGFYNSTNQYPQQATNQHGSNGGVNAAEDQPTSSTRKEVIPSIRRILSGEVPEVLLKQATSRPVSNYHQPPSSPVVLVDSTPQENKSEDVTGGGLVTSSNINKSKNSKDNSGDGKEPVGSSVTNTNGNEQKTQLKAKMPTKSTETQRDSTHQNGISSTPPAVAAIGEVAAAAATSTSSTTSATDAKRASSASSSSSSSVPTSSSSSSSSSTAESAAAHATWAVAWNIHVYLSVILFTILGVYSFYKMVTYNKLTHLFSQSYFVCIHLILMIICIARIFYLCYDAYNIHATFHIFVSEILLNLPATFLTISFSVLILFLFLKSLNHKNNRYSALIRPLTVVVGCGVHVVLCITLHYVESYTMQNHQQHLYYQQQFYRRQQVQQHATTASAATSSANVLTPIGAAALHHSASTTTVPTPPPRVLSLICQIIYIFICLSLGLLYLYIYRILKRILRSKSQNYIHGFQNLSYAIHITIATALLFVLLAALQIFGAISISITRPLITQTTAEMDWLQWGYQFSLRLIEIAIITLMSWVAGLKTSGGGLDAVVGDVRGVGPGTNSGSSAGVFGTASGPGGREKHGGHHHHHHHHNHHTNVAGFFLPCTSSSSQEQFETDYPAVCNANTNLHTYTMRTGKLIYDDSFALNSLGGGGAKAASAAVGGRSAEFQLQQPMYQRPYDTGSLHSAAHHNNVVDTLPGGSHYHHHHHSHNQYADYLTDATTDHYENPNFELRGNGSTVANAMQKLTAQTSTTSTTASCSGGSGTSAASQQQMLLLQSDGCYSEPMQQHYNPASSNYEFNNFERPKFGGSSSGHQPLHDGWSDQHATTQASRNREKKSCTHLDRTAYENPERRSSNSTHSCSSGGRYASYNSFELSNTNGVRKSGTLNNIAGGGILHGRNASSSSGASSTQRATGVHTLATADRHQQQQLHHHSQRGGGRNMLRVVGNNRGEREIERTSENNFNFERGSLERSHVLQQNSDDDMMLPASNAERTNLINDGDDSFIAAPKIALDQCANTNVLSGNERLLSKTHFLAHNSKNHANVAGTSIGQHQHAINHNFNHNNINNSAGVDSAASSSSNSAESSTASAESATSGSMLVAEHGFVRFRALEDINNAQGVGLHNASIRNPNRAAAAVVEQPQQIVAQNS